MKTTPRLSPQVHGVKRKVSVGGVMSPAEDTSGKGSQSHLSSRSGEPMKPKRMRYNWNENPEGLSLVIQHVHKNEGRKLIRLIRECFEDGVQAGYWGVDEFDTVNNKYSNLCKFVGKSPTSSPESETM